MGRVGGPGSAHISLVLQVPGTYIRYAGKNRRQLVSINSECKVRAVQGHGGGAPVAVSLHLFCFLFPVFFNLFFLFILYGVKFELSFFVYFLFTSFVVLCIAIILAFSVFSCLRFLSPHYLLFHEVAFRFITLYSFLT